jgi:hypothetical protein
VSRERESETPDDVRYEPELEEKDTGPRDIAGPAQLVDDGWGTDAADSGNSYPAQGAGAGRFDAPLTVSPRRSQSRRNPKVLWGIVAAVGAVAVAGGLVFWLVRPSSDSADTPDVGAATSTSRTSPPDSNDEKRLLRQLPKGYVAASCAPVAPPESMLAQVDCDNNSDPGGPHSATYTLAGDKAALDAVFGAAMRGATRVNCPGNIRSPGPWRRNATPDKISGQLFCGLREGQPTVVWTDDARLMVSAVRAGPLGPTFPQMYEWWSSHS